MLEGVTKHNYALVSADYRLAPQVALSEILADVQDCLKFVAEELPKHVADGTPLDTSRIAVGGSSAGGYLALLAGLYSKTPIKTILAIYPITDPYGDFFTNPQPIPWPVPVEESELASYLDRNAEVVSEVDPDSLRNKLYFYMLKTATLAKLLSVEKGDETYHIANQLRKRREGKQGFLPTYVVHGDADRFVGVEQSDEVVEALKDIGAVYEYEKIPGIDHMFDKDPSVTLEGLYGFMKKHIG